MKQKAHRLLVLAAPGWNDYEYLKSEFRRLGSIHRKITVIYPDDVEPWMLQIRDWCLHNPEQFTAQGYRKNVFLVGSEQDTERDWRMFWKGDPHEVWCFHSSENFNHWPPHMPWPHLWKTALTMNMQCVMYRTGIKSIRRKRRPVKPRWAGHKRWKG